MILCVRRHSLRGATLLPSERRAVAIVVSVAHPVKHIHNTTRTIQLTTTLRFHPCRSRSIKSSARRHGVTDKLIIRPVLTLLRMPCLDNTDAVRELRCDAADNENRKMTPRP